MITALLVTFSLAVAQWTIEESNEVHVPTDKPKVTVASLVSEEGRLVWEYSCIFLGRGFTETLELFLLKPNQECCGIFKSGNIRYSFDQHPLRRRRWNSGGSWMSPHTSQTMKPFLDGMQKYNYLTVHVETKAGPLINRFNLAGTTATLNEIECPMRRTESNFTPPESSPER